MDHFRTYCSMLVLLILLFSCHASQEEIEVTRSLQIPTPTTIISLVPTSLAELTPQPTFTPLPTTPAPTPTEIMPSTAKPHPTPQLTLWRCVPDGNIDPCHRPLYDIAMLSTNEGWMVGAKGGVFYWNGVAWEEQITPSTTLLYTIFALNSQNVWAAGEGSYGNIEFLHWDGNAWATYPISSSMPYQWVKDLWFVNENDGWAVVQEYDNGIGLIHSLLHWDGLAWTRFTEIDRLQAVYILSDDQGWASSEFGGFYHWNGESWQQADENMLEESWTSFGHGPHHIFFTAVNEGWLISSSGETAFWNGDKWQRQESLPILNVTDTAVYNNQAWITGFDGNHNFLFHWNGQRWSPTVAPPGGEIRGLSVVNENDIWAVGHTPSPTHPVIWHWDGATWNPLHSEPVSPSVNAFAMINENEAWGVGDNGYIGHWNGQQWVEFPSPTTNKLNAVDFIAPNNGWAVGDHSTMLHWDGGTWNLIKQSEDSPYYTSELQDVAFVNTEEIWAVGGVNSEGGGGPSFLHFQWDGQTWQELDPFAPSCECYFYGITMLSARDGWAVGGGYEAVTVHWDGASWQVVSNPGNYWLYSVVALAPDAVWATGTQHQPSGNVPIIVRWNGQEWIEEKVLSVPDPLPPMPTSEEWLRGKWGLGDYYWNSTSWTPIQNLTTHRIIDTDMTPSGKAIILARTGVWLELNK